MKRNQKPARMIFAQRLIFCGSTRVRTTIRIGVTISTAMPKDIPWAFAMYGPNCAFPLLALGET